MYLHINNQDLRDAITKELDKLDEDLKKHTNPVRVTNKLRAGYAADAAVTFVATRIAEMLFSQNED